MDKKRKMIFALFATALILGASCIITQEAEESDAIDPVTLTVIVLALVITSFAGGVILGSMTEPSGNEDQDRTAEAAAVAQSIAAGLAYYDNALSNYEQIWRLTNEHWIRQAEISAAALWESGKAYDPYEVMDLAGVYINSSHMMVNAAAQINAHYDSVYERYQMWQSYPAYAGENMSLRLMLGSSKIFSANGTGQWGLQLGASPVSAGYVYMAEGVYYAKAPVTITSLSGTSRSLDSYNNLTSANGFQEGVYYISSSEVCGNFLPIIGSGATAVHASVAVNDNGSSEIIRYNGTNLMWNGTVYDSLKIHIVPSSGTASDPVDITRTLDDYDALLSTVADSMRRASGSAATVWNIYDRAGAASEYLTTLMVPDFYQNMELTQAQKTLITTLALQQLSDYYQQHSGQIKTGNYLLTDGSLQLFCRGDVTTAAGKFYENVVFSPIFYRDTVLNTGANHFNGTGFVCIWGQAPTLSTWEGVSGPEDGVLIYLASGADLDIYEMKYGGDYVNTVTLEVSEIDLIDPNQIDPDPITPGEENKLVGAVTAALVILGIVALLAGILVRNPIAIIIGVALIGLGLFAAEPIAGFLKAVGRLLSI